MCFVFTNVFFLERKKAANCLVSYVKVESFCISLMVLLVFEVGVLVLCLI